jgi:hypothetical protein
MAIDKDEKTHLSAPAAVGRAGMLLHWFSVSELERDSTRIFWPSSSCCNNSVFPFGKEIASLKPIFREQ